MFQRMCRMIREADEGVSLTVAAAENQVPQIKLQLDNSVDISIEPCRRDTFPAMALASAYLRDLKAVGESETVVVCPVDPYVDAGYFQMLKTLSAQAKRGEHNLVLMGIEPTYPSVKYGYVIPKTKDAVSEVSVFKEKPDAATAERYIEQGALWNSGVFAFKLGYILRAAENLLGTSRYRELFESYAGLPKISFDYAVVEKESRIQVVRFMGMWKDLGTWNTLTEAMSETVSGNAVTPGCENTHVVNELQIPLIALGTKNLAIAATPDGILVTDKASSDKLKDYVVAQRPMYEKRVWGKYKVLDCHLHSDNQNSLTKHLIISPGRHISYQMHRQRAEIWTCIEGTGKLILDGEIRGFQRGDTVHIQPGMKHAIKADSELHIIEVQIGTELTEEDIERLDWNWENV